MAAWLRKDPALTAELLVAARAAEAPAAAHCHTLESAIAALPPGAVPELVLDVASRQLFASHPPRLLLPLHRVWREALMAADLAQVLATLTRYRDPEQARICGLLLGLRTAESPASDAADVPGVPTASSGSDELIVALQVAETWCRESFAVDAIRYQGAAVDEVRDAHHLVKIVNLARRLAKSEEHDSDAIRAAETLFGLEAELARALRKRVALDVDRLADRLGVPVHDADPGASLAGAFQALGQRLDLITRIIRFRGQLREAASAAAIRSLAGTAARTFLGIERSLLFVVDAQGKHLLAWLEDAEEPAFVVEVTPGRSLVADTLLTGAPKRGLGGAVVDRQLAGILRAEQLWCVPLRHEESKLGVLVLGLPPGQANTDASHDTAAAVFADEIAAALRPGTADTVKQESGGSVESATGAQLRFAASTPLSVIHNHLEILRTRMHDDAAALGDLERIREETVRIERILDEGQTRKPPAAPDVALNDLVQEVVASLDYGLLAPAGIRVRLQTDPLGPRLGKATQTQALLRRLLQYAGETLPTGSELLVATRGQVSVNGREHVELEIRGNGPVRQDEWSRGGPAAAAGGTQDSHPDDMQVRLRELTAAIGGTMIFTRDGSGQRFQILIPVGSDPTPELGSRGMA